MKSLALVLAGLTLSATLVFAQTTKPKTTTTPSPTTSATTEATDSDGPIPNCDPHQPTCTW